MKNKKEYMIIFVTVAALLMDILGREFAVKFVLPVWTDSIGTFWSHIYTVPSVVLLLDLPTILFMEYLLNRN